MPQTEEAKAAAALATAEDRIVWFGTFLVALGKGTNGKPSEIADKAVSAYRERYPAIQPDGTF